MSAIPAPQAYDPREAAAAVLQAVLHRDASKALAEVEVVSDELWAYGCNGNPRHVGILFFSEPQAGSDLHGGQWTAIWRPEGGGAFWGDSGDIICQQCWLEREERVPLRLRVGQAKDRKLGMTITMEPEWKRRFAHKMSRAELERFLPSREQPKAPKTETNDVNRSKQPEPRNAPAVPAGKQPAGAP